MLPADVAASDLAIAPGDDDTLYAALGDPFGHAGNGVYRSTDGGESWTELGGGLPSGAGRISLAVALRSRSTRTALMPPPVEPAIPPTKKSARRTAWAPGTQSS